MIRHSPFFKLFPPPKFMMMTHAGLDISDDALTCLQYETVGNELRVAFYGRQELPAGLLDGGDFKDEKEFTRILSEFVRRHRLSYVKVPLPEEKAYLFQTDMTSTDMRAAIQNIEFKLEENVPLSAADAVFYIDPLPKAVTGGALRASVSVVPKTYVEKMITLLSSIGLTPIAFEVAPKAIARAVVALDSEETMLILHAMNRKTGMYIVSGGAVHFSSTIGWGMRLDGTAPNEGSINPEPLAKEISRVNTYWMTRADTHSPLTRIICVGSDAALLRNALGKTDTGEIPLGNEADIWKNAFSIDRFVPTLSRDESLEYAVAAGLALPL